MPELPRRALRATLLVGLIAAGSLAACGPDPFAPVATESTGDVVFDVWALTGAPTNFPTVHLVPQRVTARPDAAASFDLAFDIDSDGRVQVLPVNRVVTPLSGGRSIGIIRPTGTYTEIDQAPRSGYIVDSVVTVNVGQVFVVRVQTLWCSISLSQVVYAKYIIDSVIPDERRIRISGRVNPNCGFRSFASGIPEF